MRRSTRRRVRALRRLVNPAIVAVGTAAAVVCVAALALAQQPVLTIPDAATTAGGNVSSTIGTGGTTFQLVFAATGRSRASGQPSVPPRRGCTIVNNGTHTMYVTEGFGVAASTQAVAIQLSANQAYYCSTGGTVLTGEIDITGTSGDAFYAAQY